MIRLLATAALLAGITMASVSAQARCGPREAILEAAFRQYAERPVALALAAGGSLLEVLATRDGSSFTLLQSSPGGTSCIIATGESWRNLPWRPPGEEGAGS